MASGAGVVGEGRAEGLVLGGWGDEREGCGGIWVLVGGSLFFVALLAVPAAPTPPTSPTHPPPPAPTPPLFLISLHHSFFLSSPDTRTGQIKPYTNPTP